MIAIRDYIEPVKITMDAIEGVAFGSNKPKPNEHCTYRFLSRVETFRCVYVTPLKNEIYLCRFERIGWK